MHKTAKILNKLLKPVQPKAKRDLHSIWQEDTRETAHEAFDGFVRVYQDKYPKATQSLEKDRQELMAFYSFPAQHWGVSVPSIPLSRPSRPFVTEPGAPKAV